MAGFMNSRGRAGKRTPDFKWKDGKMAFRMVDPLEPRYIYKDFVNPRTGKMFPLDVLNFDRDEEAFTDAPDAVRDRYNGQYSGTWSYAIYGFDLMADDPNQLVLINLKRNLYNEIREFSQNHMNGSNPADPEDGWAIYCYRKNDGSGKFGISYHLDQISTKEAKAPLTEEQMEAYNAAEPIRERVKPMSYEQQMEFLKKVDGEATSDDEPDAPF